MRAKVLAVTAAVVILPQLIVIAASFHERDVGGRMQRHTKEAALQAAGLVQGSAGADPRATGERVDRIAHEVDRAALQDRVGEGLVAELHDDGQGVRAEAGPSHAAWRGAERTPRKHAVPARERLEVPGGQGM